jgi:hypothetical protein
MQIHVNPNISKVVTTWTRVGEPSGKTIISLYTPPSHAVWIYRPEHRSVIRCTEGWKTKERERNARFVFPGCQPPIPSSSLTHRLIWWALRKIPTPPTSKRKKRAEVDGRSDNSRRGDLSATVCVLRQDAFCRFRT